MNNLRFKLFDILTSKMSAPFSINDREVFDKNGGFICDITDLDNTEITVLQWTGLKEIKGVDIYEGDVFRERVELDHGDQINHKVVIWLKERAAFYLVPIEHYFILKDNNCSNEIEFEWLFSDAALYDFSIDIELKSGIIGNIYENPELAYK